MATASTPRVSKVRTDVATSKVTGVWGVVRVWRVVVVSRPIVVFKVETASAESKWITWGTFAAEPPHFRKHRFQHQRRTTIGRCCLTVVQRLIEDQHLFFKVHLLVGLY